MLWSAMFCRTCSIHTRPIVILIKSISMPPFSKNRAALLRGFPAKLQPQSRLKLSMISCITSSRSPIFEKLPIETAAMPIIESRLDEARTAMGAGAYLSVIFFCGSVLEAVLLGAAQKEPARFNRASASPKATDGSVKRFHEWSLAQFIDVACEIGLLKPDVKKFSHGLRDFRNYIHPYEQMVSGFTPDRAYCETLLSGSQGGTCKRCGRKKMTTEMKSIPVHLRLLCAQRRFDQGQRTRYAADAGTRL